MTTELEHLETILRELRMRRDKAGTPEERMRLREEIGLVSDQIRQARMRLWLAKRQEKTGAGDGAN
jgi:hypothetical protein